MNTFLLKSLATLVVVEDPVTQVIPKLLTTLTLIGSKTARISEVLEILILTIVPKRKITRERRLRVGLRFLLGSTE